MTNYSDQLFQGNTSKDLYISFFTLSLVGFFVGLISYLLFEVWTYKKDPRIEKTKYRVQLNDGICANKYLVLPINVDYSFNSKTDLCYKYIVIKHAKRSYSIYKIDKSEGDLCFGLDRNTSMFANYNFLSSESVAPLDRNKIIVQDSDLELLYIPYTEK